MDVSANYFLININIVNHNINITLPTFKLFRAGGVLNKYTTSTLKKAV